MNIPVASFISATTGPSIIGSVTAMPSRPVVRVIQDAAGNPAMPAPDIDLMENNHLVIQ